MSRTAAKLPLAMTGDIFTGNVGWQGLGVVNPFADDGGLVDLTEFPRLSRYLETRRDDIAGRHVAKKAPANWYRTIDRHPPILATTPKLLIPDIKGQRASRLRRGTPLSPSQPILRHVKRLGFRKPFRRSSYRGSPGCSSRHIQPKCKEDSCASRRNTSGAFAFLMVRSIPSCKRKLSEAAERDDVHACNETAFRLYALTESERAALRANGNTNGN